MAENSVIRDARQLSAENRDALRIRAVRALAAGSSKKEVAESLGVSRQALHNWARLNRDRGPEALRTGRRGRPKARPLQPWQETRILSAVVLMPPVMLGLSFPCWTRKAIAELAEQWFGLRLSSYMVSSYLKRWGFDLQRSVRYRFEQTPSRLLEWLGAERTDHPITGAAVSAAPSRAEAFASGP